MIDAIKDDTPLCLSDAAALAFPHGGMTARVLRREAGKGTLAVSRIAGKDYTTLAAIRGMIERCRVEAKAHGLWLKPAKGPRRSIGPKDGKRRTSTGGGPLASLKRLERKVREYLANKYQLPRIQQRDPSDVKVADVIKIYADDVASGDARDCEASCTTSRST